MVDGDPHIDLVELSYEARLAVTALILGVGVLTKGGDALQIGEAAVYLTDAAAALERADALLSLRPLPLAPMLPLVESMPANVVVFRGR